MMTLRRPLAVFFLALSTLFATFASAAPKQTRILNADARAPQRYLIALAPGVDAAAMTNELERVQRGPRLQFQRHLRTWIADIGAEDAERLAADPRVRYVEQDSRTSIDSTQTSAPWGLDRIDQHDRPLDSSYTYNATGSGVTAYIVDTGILTSHTDFGGRASVGTDIVADGHNGIDCNGHGTHVAGTVGGTTYGVAKSVSLVAVRVLDCTGHGLVSDFVSGINWAIGNHTAGQAAVMNISIGADSPSTSFDDAITNAVADGIVVAVSAGNGTANDGVAVDACGQSPGRVANAITVSATDSSDVRGSFANFGACVDLFAPGVSITSDWYTSNSATNTISGTSMASPHVAGAAALYLQANPGSTPAAVQSGLIAAASLNKLTSIGTGSANRLLYTAGITANNSCGVNGVTTTGAAAALSSSMTAQAAAMPHAGNLPPGGVWNREVRKGGETWTYTFSIADSHSAGGAANQAATTAAALNQATTSGERKHSLVDGIAAGGTLAARPATAADAELLRAGDDDTAVVRATNGVTTASSRTPLQVARITAPVALDASASGRKVAALAATFRNGGAVASAVRVHLDLVSAQPEHLTVRLLAGARNILVWSGRDAAPSTSAITIDELLSDEIRGASLRDGWTLLVAGGENDPAPAIVNDAWLAVSAIPAAEERGGTNATIDIFAQRAYMMTGSGLSGVEVASPSVGQSVYLYADFQVSGTGTVDVTERALLDGSLMCSGTGFGLSPDFYFVNCNSPWTATAGSHTLHWDLDYNNTIAETNESNNSTQVTFSPSSSIDIFNQRSYMMTGPGLSGSEVATPTVGQSVYLYADFQITGSGTVDVSERALLDGSLMCSGSSGLIASGFYYVNCNSAWTATAGQHTLHWDLDYNNTITETNEGNNSSQVIFTPAGGVDVAAVRAYLRSGPTSTGVELDPPAVGQSAYFHADYTLSGASTATTVTARALLDSVQYCTGSNSLTNGSYTINCNAPWTATAGLHSLQWDFDTGNTIAETNESNNTAFKSFTPSTAINIAATRSFLRTGAAGSGVEIDPPAAGQSVYFHSNWQVTGSGSSVNVTIRALLDGSVFCACSALGNPGSSYTSSCNQAWQATAGSHSIQWDFDYGNAIGESNENDNSVSRNIIVPTPRVGDLDGNGSSDIFWRSYATGANAAWLMNGTSFTGTVTNLPALPNTQYRIEGIADFNGDGQPDVLWRNGTTGADALWIMSGANVGSIVNLPSLPGSNFHFEGTADMDGDGDPDILIRNYSNGANAIWIMNGTSFSGTIVNLPALPNPDYHIEAAADFNGDNKPDIIWRNYTTGANALWIMNGTSFSGTIVDLPALPNTQYRIDAAADLDKDGKNDIVWRNYSNGANAVWIMNGTSFSGTIVNLPALPDVNYELSGPR